jgi:acetyl-CoA acetyltransferase
MPLESPEVLHHRDRCAIAGIGATDFSRNSGRSDLSLATEASLAAIADAGLAAGDVDGIVRCDSDLVRPNDLANTIGLKGLDYFGEVGPGGVAPCAMVGQAVAAILAGLATTVLVFRALNGRSGRRYGLSPITQAAVGGNNTYDEFFAPYGMLTPGQIFAVMAQRHMIEFGTSEKDLGSIALTCRARANANPAAQMYNRPLTMDDYLDARMISRPLRLYDFCLETDGACAIVVTTTERARDLAQPPALIRAVAQGSLADPQPGIQFPVLMRESLTTLPARPTADTLYGRAGLGPADIDVAQLYDCFTITVLMQLEDFGFCSKGEGGAYASSGEIDIGGQSPINTGGGHLSEGYIHGMNHIVEGVRQVRGTSTSQVAGAEVCLVTSTPLPPGSALILRTDR